MQTLNRKYQEYSCIKLTNYLIIEKISNTTNMNLYKSKWYSQLMSYLVYLVVCSVLRHASSGPPGFASKPSKCRSMFHAGSLFHRWSEVRSWVGNPTVLVGPFMMIWWLSVSVSVSWTLSSGTYAKHIRLAIKYQCMSAKPNQQRFKAA